ncbi:Aste57867_16850 [Aphanomyces stellatus]|uniref:Aste57867_16850 protein n=1 Tax=Aphanomyces stellatus TaxID=120398 RepID=A0A485L7K1_9STRA|nr:hypothetical protein As57867_016792 [Aphanomyces stellatus]VFT93614.1 Aste57867_16850 [Aphanomyces stellatus]
MTSSSSSWQSNGDIPTRRTMIHKLLWVFQHKQQAMQRMLSSVVDLNNDASSTPLMDARLPSLVRRLELALYLRAASMAEYLNEQSLQRRVQHLIVSLHHQAIVSHQDVAFHMRASPQRTTPRADDRQPAKKARRMTTRPPATSILFLGNQEQVVAHVFAFVDGPDVVRCLGLNRFAAAFLVSNVRYLTLSWAQCTHLVDTASLARFARLERLVVRPPPPSSSPHIHTRHIAHANEAHVRRLAAMLPSTLERLDLTNTYIHTDDVNATQALCHTLADRCRRLTHLALAGNALGDAGMAIVASSVLHLPALVSLDLRRNYIGEGGMHALAAAVVAPLALETLLLGSNIAAHAVSALAAAVATRRLQRLRVFGLEDNFIDLKGVEALAAALQQGVCPALHELCIGDNIVDNRVIQSVFSFAVPKPHHHATKVEI